MKRNITGKMICLLVLFVAAVFVGADLPVSAQDNANSGSTGDSMMQSTNNGNTSARRGRRRARRQARRARRRARRNADANMTNANANMSDANANSSADTTGTQDTNMNMSGGGGQGGSTPGMGTFGDVADLSGTYTGRVNYAEGGMSGDATLTITSNTFTITAGSATASGTLSARSWPGYTALSMRFGDTLPATIISTRAWHRGRNLRIQSVRGESRAFTFNGRSDAAGGSGGAAAADTGGGDAAAAADAGGGTTTRARGRRSRGRRGRRSAPAVTTTTDATPTPTPTPGQ